MVPKIWSFEITINKLPGHPQLELNPLKKSNHGILKVKEPSKYQNFHFCNDKFSKSQHFLNVKKL